MDIKKQRVIATCFLLLAFSISGLAQETLAQQYAATLDGTSGLFKTWDAESLRRGELNFSFGYDQFNHDPGNFKLGRVVIGGAVGVVDTFEIFGSVDANRRIWNPPNRAGNRGEPLSSRGDIKLGAKFNVMSERLDNHPFSFAIAVLGKYPGAMDGIPPGLSETCRDQSDARNDILDAKRCLRTYDAGGYLLFSKTAADIARFHVNFGGVVTMSRRTLVRDELTSGRVPLDLDHRFDLRYGAEVPLPSHPSLRFIGEMNVSIPTPAYVIAGARYYPKNWVALGAAYQASIHSKPVEQETVNRHGFIVQGTLGRRVGAVAEREPLTVSCVIPRTSILLDETVTVRASVSNPAGGKLKYTWSASGGNINGVGDQADFSAGEAGTYTVTATVSNRRETASCSESITVNRRAVAPTVSVEPATFSLLPGESVNLRCAASDPSNSRMTYSWKVNGEPLAAEGPQITFGSAGRSPGSYNVTCTASNGEFSKDATSSGTIRERPNQAPAISCDTTTVIVASGSSIELRATASDPDNDRLTYSWSSPVGALSGNNNTATFNAGGVRAGSYNVTVNVDDGRGGKAACNMVASVSERRAIASAGAGGDGCGYFAANGGARVDNCAKAVLDDIALQLRNNSSMRANIIGYTDNTRAETSKKGLGEARAKAVAAYLQERGIDSSRIQISNGGVGSFGDNATAAGRTLNRRVEIEISPR